MAMTEYDKAHLADIIYGEGTWFNARLLRALNELLPYADAKNRAILMTAYPEQCDAVLEWWEGKGE